MVGVALKRYPRQNDGGVLASGGSTSARRDPRDVGSGQLGRARGRGRPRSRGPQGRRRGRTVRRGHEPVSRGGPRGRDARPALHPGRHRDLLPQRDVAGGSGGAPGSEPRHLHGPRQRMAEPVPRLALSPDPERLRAQPGARGQRFEHQYFGEARIADEREPRQGRRRPAQSPVLRVGQQRAWRSRGHARHGPPARRQLRGGLHQGGRRPRSSRRRTRAPTTW